MEHTIPSRASCGDITQDVDETAAAAFHAGDPILQEIQSRAQNLEEAFGCDGTIGLFEKDDLLDVADRQTAILELADEADSVECSRIVGPMPRGCPSGFIEESSAFIESNRVARHAAARCGITNP